MEPLDKYFKTYVEECRRLVYHPDCLFSLLMSTHWKFSQFDRLSERLDREYSQH